MSFLNNLIKDPKYQTADPRKPEEVGDPAVIISPDTRRENRIPPGQSRTKKWPVLDAHDARVRVLAKLNRWLDGREPAGARIVLWKFKEGGESATSLANDDDEIITAHLSALLGQSRCKVFRIQADPRSTTISQLEKLQATDAVVVLGKFGDAELKTIRSIVPQTIDARVREPSAQSQL